MKRRTFLHRAAHSLAIPGLMGSFGFAGSNQRSLASLLQLATASNKVLVLIYLQGGNDGLNTVIPMDQLSNLNRVRPHIVLPEKSLHRLKVSDVALHPSLGGFKNLYEEGRLAIVQSVGYPDQNYSHFRSTDIWMSGSGAHELITSGWTGRYLQGEYPDFPTGYPNDNTPHPLAIELGYGASLLFQGPLAAMGTVISDPDAFYQLVENGEEEAPDNDAGQKLKYVRLIARQSQQYGRILKEAADKVPVQMNYPVTDLGQQLKIVAKLIAGGLQTSLYLVRMGGFDTHDDQVLATDHTKGRHADLLKQLNDAVISFMDDLKFQKLDDRVVGMTFSEFGRRIISNAGLGTDHGSASPVFVFGNQVRGGIIGTNPVVPMFATYEDNLQQQFDFKQLYASLLSQWFETNPGNIASVLNGTFTTVPLIGNDSVGLKETLSIYPNPIPPNSNATIEFVSNGGNVSIEVVDMTGRKVAAVYNGSVPVGGYTLSWDASYLYPGRYLVVVRGATGRAAMSVIKTN